MSADRPVRVLVALHEDVLGGASRVVVRLVPLLRERGFELSFWASRPSELADRLEAEGCEVAGAPRQIAYSRVALSQPPGTAARLASIPRYLREFRRHLRGSQPDLVHANSIYSLAEVLVARTTGTPVVLHVHEMEPASWKAGVLRTLAAASGAEVVAVSRACAHWLELRGRVPRVVYGGAQVPGEAPDRSARKGPIVIGTVGVISRRKGSDLFVAAARRVREAGLEAEFRMIGSLDDVLDRQWADGVLADAAATGIAHRLEADAAAEMRDWDLFVLPSRYDPFPTASLEAMAAALPVVATEVDGLAEQVAPDTGMLVPAGNAKAVAEAIVELGRSPADRARMGAAGRERVLREFTLERQADGLAAAYRAALDR